MLVSHTNTDTAKIHITRHAIHTIRAMVQCTERTPTPTLHHSKHAGHNIETAARL